MSHTYGESSRERTQSMLGGHPGLPQYHHSQIPLKLEEMEVQTHMSRAVPSPSISSEPQPRSAIQGRREPMRDTRYKRTEVVYESNHVPFHTILTPLTSLTATSSDNGARIRFEMTRDHVTGDTTLQWEPFQGIITSSGTECLEVQQSIIHLPAYIVDIPIFIEVRGTRKMSFLRIDPYSSINIKFFLDISGTGSTIAANDKVFVPGCCVRWKSFE